MLIKYSYKLVVTTHCLKELVASGFNVPKLGILKLETELMEDPLLPHPKRKELLALLDKDDIHPNAR